MSTRRHFLKWTATAGAASMVPFMESAADSDSKTGVESLAGKRGVDYAQTLEAARLASQVTGASFAYWDGNSLHTAVAGLRNSVTGDPVTIDTVMHVGSITKIMNTVLVMQLVDDGKISLGDPVLKHLPELRLRDTQALRRITCAMLLNHTSGINCDWLPEYGPDQERIVDSIDRCSRLGQLFPPGEETSYCNMGSVIAGYLVQKLRATSWYTLVKARIYEPLGMQHALVDTLEVPRFRASIGDLTDTQSGKLVQTTRPFLAPSFAPAGSTQMSTATDLVTFARAMLNGGVGANGVRILSAASAERMTQPTAAFVRVGSEDNKVGLGWMISPGNLLNHGGGGPGISSHLFVHPKSGRIAALLTNCDKGDDLKSAFLDPIAHSWTGVRDSKAQRQSGPINAVPYVGTYEDNITRYIVSHRDEGLSLRMRDKFDTFDNYRDEDSSATALYPIGNDTFEAEEPSHARRNMQIRFIRPNAAGQMRFVASWGRLLARAN
jgi:CubicO group peptidase (beta-lactamase class C family)